MRKVILSLIVSTILLLFGSVSSDADNLYITLSARSLNRNLYIITRSSSGKRVKSKLKRAGADKVISPYDIGATRMASLSLIRPLIL